MHLPDFFKISFENLMKPEEFEAFKESFDGRRRQGLRTNTLKISPGELRELLGKELSTVPWIPEGFYYEGDFSPGKSPFYHAGLYYIQEPSAMMPALALAPLPGEKVLDLCAAPGGKSTYLGTMMKSTGLLVSNDISPKRVKALVKNIELMGLTNTYIVNETPERLAQIYPGYFDRILLDVPCSGEGMFRKDKEAVQSYTRFKSEECVAMQRAIFHQAYTMLAPGGVIVYSTCTFNPDENERNMEYFISRYGLKAEPLFGEGGWEASRKEWTESKSPELERGIRLWPHKAEGEGHFVFRLKKEGEMEALSPESTGTGAEFTSKESEKGYKVYREFMDRNIQGELPWLSEGEGCFHLAGTRLYRLPSPMNGVPHISWEKAGLYLGDFNKGRFEPSQSLAMAFQKDNFIRTVDLNPGGDEVYRYLKGETLLREGEKGYTGVCVGGFPLGWGKQDGSILKNLYPKGWRMLA